MICAQPAMDLLPRRIRLAVSWQIRHGGWANIGGPGGIYFIRAAVGMFAPFLSIAAIPPTRKGAWRMRAEFFDYRAAQNSGAHEPRDGAWKSRPEVWLSGHLELLRPTSAAELPGPIFARGRLSRLPAHVAPEREDGGDSYQKVSARPREGACEWKTIDYDDAVFGAHIRTQYWGAFVFTSVPQRQGDKPTTPLPSSPKPTLAHPANPAVS